MGNTITEYPTLLDFDKRAVPRMPEEFVGEVRADCGYTLSAPREWTDEEIEFVTALKEQGYTNAEIAESIGRTEVSVSIKTKRIGKKKDTYNDAHRQEKYDANLEFYNSCKPEDVLDCFCGTESWWRGLLGFAATTNDINKDIKADYHLPADKFLMDRYIKGFSYDLVDLDPFGSAYDCFDLAIKLAKKAVIVTFGEMGHKRWKRLDYVRYRYGINDLSDFTTSRLIDEFRRIGWINKKDPVPVIVKEWPRISRVYFELHPMKITEQWK